jgi:hypothetical protein
MEAGLGISIISDRHLLAHNLGMRHIPIINLLPLESRIVWAKNNKNPCIGVFLDIVNRVI